MTVGVGAPGLFARRNFDKWAFFVVLGLGIAAIITADVMAMPKIEAVAACSGLIAIYAAAVMFLPALRLRPDQVGDNCYYLGLLFTLTSLGLALYRFASSDLGTDSILRNFGIAIGTTIIGLGLRVGITQFREDPEDLEYEAREALASTVRRLRADLDQSVAELQRFSDGARQALAETSEAARNATSEALSSTAARFEAALTETTQAFNENTAGFNKRAVSINRSLEKVVEAVDALTERIASVRPDEQLMQAGMKPALEALQSAVVSFGDALESQKARIDGSFSSLEKFSEAADQFELSASALSRAASEFEGSMSRLGQGTELIERLDETTRSAAAAATTLAEQMNDAASSTGKVAEVAIHRIETAAANLTDRTSTSLSAVEQVSARTVETFQRLNAEFSGSSQSVEHVRRELAELAGWIIARLDRE